MIDYLEIIGYESNERNEQTSEGEQAASLKRGDNSLNSLNSYPDTDSPPSEVKHRPSAAQMLHQVRMHDGKPVAAVLRGFRDTFSPQLVQLADLADAGKVYGAWDFWGQARLSLKPLRDGDAMHVGELAAYLRNEAREIRRELTDEADAAQSGANAQV